MAKPKKAPLTPEEKLEQKIGKDTVAEIQAMSPEELKARITYAQRTIRDAKAELEANENYRQVKTDLKHLSEGYRDVKKRQNLITEYAIKMLESKGQ